MTLTSGDLAEYAMTRSIGWPLCDSSASCATCMVYENYTHCI